MKAWNVHCCKHGWQFELFFLFKAWDSKDELQQLDVIFLLYDESWR